VKRIVFIGIFIVFALSCNDEVVSNIPQAPVNLTLYLSDLDSRLNGAFSYKEFTTPRNATDRLGYGGILVINGSGPDIVNLRAYDLSCPVEAQRNIRVEPNDIGQAKCPKCGAVYDIATSNGAPLSGSKFYLKQYSVYKDNSGSDRYRVTN
jgi:uncharacterized Zn-finger protein